MAALVIRDENGKEVRRVDVTGRHTRQIERIEIGMLINMDRDKYTVGQEG